jgi:molybdopterin-guanine dinucleotide biosynthesis protein A
MDGVVLAGGRSVRMDADKGRLPTPEGLAWAVHMARILSSVCARVGIVRREGASASPWFEPAGLHIHDIWESAETPLHPLTGLATACRWSRTPLVLVVPVDLVRLKVEDVQQLVVATHPGGATGEADVLKDASGALISEQPLFGVFPRALAHLATDSAQRGDAVRHFLNGATKVALPNADLRNANRWSDTGWPHPLAQLRQRDVSERALEAERERLRARGLTLPPELG